MTLEVRREQIRIRDLELEMRRIKSLLAPLLEGNAITGSTIVGVVPAASIPDVDVPGGPPGMDGEQGEQGDQGPPGATGQTGPAGATGPAGSGSGSAIPGFDGLDGELGDRGPPGSQGATGSAGAAGAAGATGAAGAQGTQGSPGFDGADGEDGLTIPGPQGATGASGATGPIGPTGAAVPGYEGLDGADGNEGPPGPTGAAGATGAASKIAHAALFVPTAAALAVETMFPNPGVKVASDGNTAASTEHGALAAVKATAICGTAGTGTNTIIIEAAADETFAGAITLFTISLGTATNFTDSTLDNAWTATKCFIRARCTAVGATAPLNVVVHFYYTEAGF